MEDIDKIKLIFESLIMASSKPISLDKLLEAFPEDQAPSKKIAKQALEVLAEDYAQRSVELKEVSNGYRFQVNKDYAAWTSKLWEEKPARYSRALLETLCLVAYKQPITRGEIEKIRGVSVSSHILKTLMERDWVHVVGHRDVPGKPALYATTRDFLDYFNLKSLEELPPLSEIRDIDQINAELDLALPQEPADEAQQPQETHEAVEKDVVKLDVDNEGADDQGKPESVEALTAEN